jgi:hypothetical protein
MLDLSAEASIIPLLKEYLETVLSPHGESGSKIRDGG